MRYKRLIKYTDILCFNFLKIINDLNEVGLRSDPEDTERLDDGYTENGNKQTHNLFHCCLKNHSLKSYRAEKIVSAVPRQCLIESRRGTCLSCCVAESSETIQRLDFRG